MKKTKQNFMDLNRETAMRLWSKSFGKETKVKDFAGRTIAKGAYNDRNSEFGWNVDHILPQSKGGITADHNLICCHILTNDEKANKFPCFNANGTSFEIIKVQNHYEIEHKNKEPKTPTKVSDTVNFFDSAAGLRYFEKLKDMQNKKRFVGTVSIRLRNVSNNAVVDFVEKLFENESIAFNRNLCPNTSNSLASLFACNNDICITITKHNMHFAEDISTLLDKCGLLNTYLSAYFLECNYVSSFDIHYRVDGDNNQHNMCENIGGKSFSNSMFVNEFVLKYTEIADKGSRNFHSDYIECKYIFPNLFKNLKKEASRK